jgi:hypothetical protein
VYNTWKNALRVRIPRTVKPKTSISQPPIQSSGTKNDTSSIILFNIIRKKIVYTPGRKRRDGTSKLITKFLVR